MNNTYKITVTSPLLRPGLTVETEVSENYLVDGLVKIMDAVRGFNILEEERREISLIEDIEKAEALAYELVQKEEAAKRWEEAFDNKEDEFSPDEEPTEEQDTRTLLLENDRFVEE